MAQEDSFELVRSEDANHGFNKRLGSTVAGRSPAHSKVKAKKAGGGDDSKSLSDEVVERLYQDPELRERMSEEDRTKPSFHQGYAGRQGEELLVSDDEDDSQKVRLSEERGDVKPDIALISNAIENFGAYYFDGQPLDQEYRNQIKAIPEKRLRAVAEYTVYTGKQTLLHKAAVIGDHEILQLLLDHGAKVSVDSANDKGFTPLTLAVDSRDKKGVQILLGYTQHREDALCAAIEFYELETDPEIKIERQSLIKWLISLPEIGGRKREGRNDRIDSCFNTVCQPLPESGLRLTAFQCLCYYQDKAFFDELLEAMPEKLAKIPDRAGDTFLHLAVRGADPKNNAHLQLIKKLIDLQKPEAHQSPWVTELNDAKQTVLDIACERYAYPVIDLLAVNGAMLVPDSERLNIKSTYLSPLHKAIINSDLPLLRYLFEKFSIESELIFRPEKSQAVLQGNDADESKKKDILEKLFSHALQAWRDKVLANQDHTVQEEILRELLKRDTDERIFLSLFRKTERKIHANIKDEATRKSLSDLCSKVHSDYCLVSRQNDAVSIELKLKALCLVSSIKKVAKSYSKQKDSTPVEKEEATKHFMQCLRYLLYLKTWKILVGIAVCALLGMIVGAVTGFIVGQLLSGGTGGGFVLGPPAAEYGWAVGTILGCVIFGAGLAGTRYLFSDLFKSHMSHWAISKAMRNNINSHDDRAAKKDNPSPREGVSSEGGVQDFGVDKEFSFDGDTRRLLDSQAN